MHIAQIPTWTYRPDVDGLRAVAVIAVLLSHLDLLDGGYVGVDVFFVISGYVVFGDLLRRIETGTSSSLAFYMRRIRRLLPNLMVMALCTLAASMFLLLPSDLVRLPARVAASILGFSNWLFAYQSGYFEPSSKWNPLLHTWTLAVEFQFYIIAPILLGLIHKDRRTLFLSAISILLLASLIYAIVPRSDQTSWHFYDSFGRAWEFLLGILLNFLRPPAAKNGWAGLIGWCATGLLVISFVFLGRDGSYPDARALVPTTATAALILVVPKVTVLNAFLSFRPVTLTGKASYAIYIWHWPIIVLTGYLSPDFFDDPMAVGLVLALILGVSFTTYYFVEYPMRSARHMDIWRFWKIVILLTCATTLLGAVVLLTSGLPSRFTAHELRLDREALQVSPRRLECHLSAFDRPLEDACIFGADVPPTIAVWSDSHGVELTNDLAKGLAIRGESAVLYSFSSCPPRLPRATHSDCARFNEAVLARLLDANEIKTVILAAALDTDLRREDKTWGVEFLSAANALRAKGKRLVIIYPVPEQPFDVPRAIVNKSRFGIDYQSIRTKHLDYLMRTKIARSILDSLGNTMISRIYPDRLLCQDIYCRVDIAGYPLYFDDNHLNMLGASSLSSATLLTLP